MSDQNKKPSLLFILTKKKEAIQDINTVIKDNNVSSVVRKCLVKNNT
jgi:hypothetical protein